MFIKDLSTEIKSWNFKSQADHWGSIVDKVVQRDDNPAGNDNECLENILGLWKGACLVGRLKRRMNSRKRTDKKMYRRNHGGEVSKDQDKNTDYTKEVRNHRTILSRRLNKSNFKFSKGYSGWSSIKGLCSGKDRSRRKIWYSGLQK